VCVAMAVLTVDHTRHGAGLVRAVHDSAMATETFDFFVPGMHSMQFFRCVVRTEPKGVTIDTHGIRDLADMLNLSFVAGILWQSRH
jgi:hypothetical protein